MPFREDRDDKGGGLLLYVKVDIPCRRIPFNFTPNIETMIIEINLKKENSYYLVFTIPTRI